MNVLVLGAGNLLLSDEGFGVHLIRYLEANYRLPAHVDLCDAGTAGLMITHRIEEAGFTVIVDAVAADAPPGTLLRYGRDDLMLDRIPAKLSPHQIGVQEMLLVSDLRGRGPRDLMLIGAVPASTSPGTSLTPLLQARLPEAAALLATELRERGAADLQPLASA